MININSISESYFWAYFLKWAEIQYFGVILID